jgi:hypothetical protein
MHVTVLGFLAFPATQGRHAEALATALLGLLFLILSAVLRKLRPSRESISSAPTAQLQQHERVITAKLAVFHSGPLDDSAEQLRHETPVYETNV